MTEREKIAHFLRRFGLGAGKYEVDLYAQKGLDATIHELIHYDKVEEKFPVSPYEFSAYDTGLFQTDPSPYASWWALRMVLTRRPLQEKLTLFWHDHFAVSGEKVVEGLTMLDYLQTLRKGANGNFRTLLKDVSKSPAMILYLDTQASTKERPNENFAREVMELFTLGQGNYTEKDIQQAAKAFTGWTIFYAGIGNEKPFDKLVQEMALAKRSVFEFAWVPALHDPTEKTILGKKANFDGDQVLDLLCDQPRTAIYIAQKLADWFAGPTVSDAYVQMLAKVFRDSNLEIKPVLEAIASSNEFWSDKCVRSRVKSPLDFTGALFRQLALQDLLLQMHGTPKNEFTPIAPIPKGTGQGLLFLMNQQGFLLLYPPNVAGWDWGKAWATSANTIARINTAEVIFRGEDKTRPIASYLVQKITAELKATTEEGLVDGVLAIFDGDVPAKTREAMILACKNAGGMASLKDVESRSVTIAAISKVLFAAPEFQLV